MPDRDCRFRSADLVLDFEEHAGGKSLPFVVRLRPQEQASKKVVKVENKGEAELAASDPVAKSFSVKLGDSETRTDEITRMLVELASFGPGTQQAGWRFQLTESRDIALSSPELELLVAAACDATFRVHLRLVAEIEVRSSLDRWLTWAFRGKPSPLDDVFEFPTVV